jgi:sec-independent protein translocase protein TatB
MFDLDIGKMLVFGIVALAVIPPKDLPRVLRTVGKYVGQMRRMAADFQGQFAEALKEADIESVKKEFQSMEASAKIDSSFDPVSAMRTEMTKAVEAPSPAPVETVVSMPTTEADVHEAKIEEIKAVEPFLKEDEPFLKEVVVTPLAPEAEPATVTTAEFAPVERAPIEKTHVQSAVQ